MMGILYRLRCWILAVLSEWQEYQEYKCLRRNGAVLWMPPEHPNCPCSLERVQEAIKKARGE
jgi:hypothetical protein